MLIAMEAGVIPGNLHFNQPNPEIAALHDGRIQVNGQTLIQTERIFRLPACNLPLCPFDIHQRWLQPQYEMVVVKDGLNTNFSAV